MNLSPPPTDARWEQIDHLAHELIPQASQLTRLALRLTGGEISRSEGGILRTLSEGPRRVTELAELEGLAQPTTTTLIKQLEQRGWVERGRDPQDGRAVRVSLAPEGARALQRYRARYRSVLRDRLATLPDEQIAALTDALEPLAALTAAMQKGEIR